MEEHHEAYFHWKRLGVRNAWCWHFDAHLDIGREGLDAARLRTLAGCGSSADADQQGVLGNCYLPWGGLHCGNYLYPAIAEGIVGRLTWVIPPYLPQGDLLKWARAHLDGWFELSLTDHASLRVEDGRVVGEVLGVLIEVGTWETLTPPDGPVLVDVDIDYFLTEDGQVWWEPDEVAAAVRTWDSLATTVAYSVKGGYTPTAARRLANPFLESPAPPGYVAGALDHATTLHRCHRYDEAIAALEAVRDDHPLEAAYYLGSCYQKLEQPLAALELLEPLCEDPSIPADGQSYLRGLCGELCLKAQRWEEAMAHAAAGKKLQPSDYRHYWTEAMARESTGDPKTAIKLVRRALRLAEDKLFSLRIRLALGRLYRRQGQWELARAELARLASVDLTGEYRSATVSA